MSADEENIIRDKNRKKRRIGLLRQVAAIFIIGILLTGFNVFSFQSNRSDKAVVRASERIASNVAREVKLAIKEYPAYRWLLQYWYEHHLLLDVEYDVQFGPGTRTEEKCRLLRKTQPDLELRYADTKTIMAMTDEEQELYAEITYSWLITRINEIKRSYRVDFLFGVVTEEPYNSQFFLFSAADAGGVRGGKYEDAYPLGVTATVGESQQKGMQDAIHNKSHLTDAGEYMDYYVFLHSFDGHDVLLGLTYNLSDIRNNIRLQAIQGTLYNLFGQVALALICLLMINYSVIRPLRKVQKNIRQYMQTKDSKTVQTDLSELQSRNEIGELSSDVSGLAAEIDDYLSKIEKITAERQRIDTELGVAARIQSTMLPDTFPAFPDRKEFDIYAAMDPAREVGGDFYDFFLIDEDHLCLLIADVSGKGIPASLFMMSSQAILVNNALMGKSPGQILADANAAICRNNKVEMFLTAWIGILDIPTGKIIAANAGHEYPIVSQADGHFALQKDKHSFVVGGMENVVYTEYTLQMTPGSRLFVYTDGLPEANNPGQEMFGTDRILEALNCEPDTAPQKMLENVRVAVDAFVQEEEQFDDLTMMCLAWYGSQNRSDDGEA